MVKQLTLKEYIEDCFNIKCRNIDGATEVLKEVKTSASRGNMKLFRESIKAAMDWIIEDFEFSTKASTDQIEKSIKEFYQLHGYECLSRTNRGYVFQKRDDTRWITLACSPKKIFISVTTKIN